MAREGAFEGLVWEEVPAPDGGAAGGGVCVPVAAQRGDLPVPSDIDRPVPAGLGRPHPDRARQF